MNVDYDFNKYDLFILYVDLSDDQSKRYLGELRSLQINIPIIVISTDDSTPHRIAMLDLGADDYMAEPVFPRELEARVRALHRRCNRVTSKKFYHGAVFFSLPENIAYLNGKRIHLTASESAILGILFKNQNRVVTKQELVEELLESKSTTTLNLVECRISRIRKKIGTENLQIKTIYGLGYQLKETEKQFNHLNT